MAWTPWPRPARCSPAWGRPCESGWAPPARGARAAPPPPPPPATMFFGLTNDTLGYFTPEDEWMSGRNNGYEETVSLGPQAAPPLARGGGGLLGGGEGGGGRRGGHPRVRGRGPC